MEESRKNVWSKCVAILLTVFLALYLFSFQVDAGNVGVVYFFGEYSRTVDTPGFNFKLPYPLHTVSYLPAKNRTILFDTKMQECLTNDKTNLVLTVTTGWNITDPKKFVSRVKSLKDAEEKLSSRVNSARNKALQNFSLQDLVNTDYERQQKQFSLFEARIKEFLDADLGNTPSGTDISNSIPGSSDLGITISYIGVKQMGFAADVTEKVFERMKKERSEASRAFLEEGKKEASIIVSEAEAEAQMTIANALSKSEIRKGEGDAEAAKNYAIFNDNPELANYLREIKTLRKVLANNKSTVVLNTQTAPFRLLEQNATPTLPIKAKQ